MLGEVNNHGGNCLFMFVFIIIFVSIMTLTQGLNNTLHRGSLVYCTTAFSPPEELLLFWEQAASLISFQFLEPGDCKKDYKIIYLFNCVYFYSNLEWRESQS